MTDLETQLRAYGEQIDSERSPIGLLEATRPDIPVVSQSRESRATEPSTRRRIAAVVVLVAVAGLGAWAFASNSGSQDPMLPPAATTSLPSPSSTITNDPLTTTSGDATDDQEGAVDQATLDMLHSYVEMRWSGDVNAAMALVADSDRLSDSETRYAGLESLVDPWFSWAAYSSGYLPGAYLNGLIPERRSAETWDWAEEKRHFLLQARTAMVGPLVFEVELGTELIAMDCEQLQIPSTLIRCFAEATNQLHPAGSEPFTHVFEFFVVDGRIFAVGSTSYEWAPANRTELDETLRNAWRNACQIVFEEGIGFVPSYPDTVEGWTDMASSCADFALEHFAAVDRPG